MRALELHRDQPAHELAADLRRAFSGIVTGNVKEYGIGPSKSSGRTSCTAIASLDETAR